ncbi:hypothetical protein N657DRAFT_688527 [Parathielavia appendiculata]|uniref:Uncharacterized protein n=1 Tax=Parathielavia appendiculata TaxID=2587402 RepID=A0AAN6U6C8_9PEZI|nr:hypothetical protein N657DRAFT_688527 [Parathielavia appendiculata]
MDEQLKDMKTTKLIHEVTCRLYYDTATEPQSSTAVTPFAQNALPAQSIQSDCPTCKAPLLTIDAVDQPKGGYCEQSDSDGGEKRSRRKKQKKEKREVGDDDNWAQRKLRDRSKWIEQYSNNYPSQELMTSAKTIAVKNKTLIWQREGPDNKIIVFVNWAKLACIMGRLFEEQIPFLYYFGDLSLEEKAAAINDFRDRLEIKVLASGRVHRIGQTKPTYLVKILVKNIIDEGLLEIQQAKEGGVAKALQKNGSYKTERTAEELMKFFQIWS